jgi:hypothetical protein
MLSIVIIMFGNSLITFLKLEERFPWLKRVIDFRFKFTKYSLTFNFILIFICLSIMLFLNIYTFSII